MKKKRYIANLASTKSFKTSNDKPPQRRTILHKESYVEYRNTFRCEFNVIGLFEKINVDLTLSPAFSSPA